MPMMTRSAQSLIELLIAVGAVAAVLVAIASVSTRGLSGQTYAVTAAEATKLSEDQIESVRAYRDQYGYAALATLACFGQDCHIACGSGDCTVFVNSPYLSGVLTVWFRLSTTCPGGSIQVTATSQWIDSRGTHSPTIKTCLTGWKR